MTAKEIQEIKNSIGKKTTVMHRVRGCYVNGETNQIISSFSVNPDTLMGEERKEFTMRFKKCLSGKTDKNMMEAEFPTSDVAKSEKHALVRELLETDLSNQQAADKFFSDFIERGYVMPTNYLILVGTFTYYVKKSAGGTDFHFMVCAICPVKQKKNEFCFASGQFQLTAGNWAAAAPSYGFTFPAFTRRAADLYHSIYYTKSGEPDELVQLVFGAELPMSPTEQKDALTIAFSQIKDECTFGLLESLRSDMATRREEHEKKTGDEPFTVSIDEMQESLFAYGIDDKKVNRFGSSLETELGGKKEIDPDIFLPKKMNVVVSPHDGDVVVKAAVQSVDDLRFQVVGGKKYLMIPAGEEVTCNGIPISD